MATQCTHRGIGFFSEEENAEQAIRALESSDFPMDQVSILAKQLADNKVAGGAKTGSDVQGRDINTTKQMPEQAATGAFWGGLMGGISALAFPGAGTVLAVGSLGTAFASLIAGQGVGAAATHSLKKGLESLGIPEEKTGNFSDRLVSEDFMVVVDGNQEEVKQAESVLSNKNIQAWDIYPIPAA